MSGDQRDQSLIFYSEEMTVTKQILKQHKIQNHEIQTIINQYKRYGNPSRLLVGNKIDLTYPYLHLSKNIDYLNEILSSKSFFSKELDKAKFSKH